MSTQLFDRSPLTGRGLSPPPEAVALHRGETGEPIESPNAKRAALKELAPDPDEITEAGDRNETLPESIG